MTVLMWRKGTLSPKLRALRDVLTAHAVLPKKAGAGASVPIPKFAPLCGTLVCELRNRRTLATYRSSVALVQKSASRTRRKT
jgi:hypothetical protein